MKNLIFRFVFTFAVLGHAYAFGKTLQAVTLTPEGSLIKVGEFSINLGEPDSLTAPTAWQGPLHITRLNGKSCTVGDEVGIIEKPLSMEHSHLLYVSTYSGSLGRLFVVDAQNCAVKWTSSPYVGSPIISGKKLALPGQPSINIGVDGLPKIATYP